TAPSVEVNLNFVMSVNLTSPGYLYYISIEATRGLILKGEQILFKNNQVANTPGNVEYSLSNAASVSEIWDISNKYEVTAAANTERNSVMNFKSISGISKQYLAVTPSDYYEPLRDSKTSVSNQNIKGSIFKDEQGQFQDVDYIIITPNNLVSQAERLA